VNRFIWSAIGLGGVATLLGKVFAPRLLGRPLAGAGPVYLTPHGAFGAHRDGPPVHTHQGVDFHAAGGEYVLAVGDGVIVHALPGLGKTVRKLKLEPAAAWKEGCEDVAFIVYADLGRALVEPGDRVKKGQAIAYVAPEGFVHFATKRVLSTGAEMFFDPALAGFDYRGGGHVV
jgi:murein DD-endopeptidase MepM/ murein hydrolase activator NlpD